jgi:SLOG family YspA-like protein
MKVLVCGGRDYNDYETVRIELDKIRDITEIIHGGARGADTLGGKYAAENNIRCTTVPALWDRYGKSAGYRRNVEMLRHNPDVVLAFPGQKGTAMMIKLAKEANVRVIEI